MCSSTKAYVWGHKSGYSPEVLGGVIFITSDKTFQECIAEMGFGEYSTGGRECSCDHVLRSGRRVYTRLPFISF